MVSPGAAPRWLLVNALPLSGDVAGTVPLRARVVTTFSDITNHIPPQSGPELVAQDLPELLRLIRDLTESARQGLTPDHPSLQPIRRALELSSRAVHLAAQVFAAQPSDTASPA